MIAEISTLLWFAYVAYLFVQHFILGNLNRYEAKYKLVVSWLTYCIPIHIHGFIPFYYNRQMMHMSEYPDTYFGAYGRYCIADPRYCADDIFVQMIQGGTALFLTPCCVIALVAVVKKLSWRHAMLILLSFPQLLQTIYFFIEPFKLPTNPIPSAGIQFYFDFLFMNSLWIIVPGWIIVGSFVQVAKGQALVDQEKGKALTTGSQAKSAK